MAQIKKQWKEVIGTRNIAVGLTNQFTQHQAQLEQDNKTSGKVTPEQLAQNKEQLAKYKKEISVLKEIAEHMEKVIAPFNDLRDDAEVDFAMTQDGTPKTALLRDEKTGSLLFTPEGEKKARKAIRELKEQEVFIDVLELPAASKLEYDFFDGYVSYKKK